MRWQNSLGRSFSRKHDTYHTSHPQAAAQEDRYCLDGAREGRSFPERFGQVLGEEASGNKQARLRMCISCVCCYQNHCKQMRCKGSKGNTLIPLIHSEMHQRIRGVGGQKDGHTQSVTKQTQLKLNCGTQVRACESSRHNSSSFPYSSILQSKVWEKRLFGILEQSYITKTNRCHIIYTYFLEIQTAATYYYT